MRLILLLIIFSSASFAQEPTLRETLEFIKSKVDESKYFLAVPAASFLVNSRLKFEINGSDECSPAIIENLKIGEKGENTIKDGYIVFKLRDIDIGNINLSDYSDKPSFGHYNLEIPASYKNKFYYLGTEKNSKTNELKPLSEEYSYRSIYFDDKETAERVKKSIIHAAKLCGAKPDPF